MMSTFVLVHGAYHGAWCWSRLTPLLESQGHRVLAPDLPGHGEDQTPLSDVTLSNYTAAICQVVASADEPVILVGHSMAGAVVAGAAERMASRVRQLVFLTAYIPGDGQSVAQMVRADTRISIPIERVGAAGVPCLRMAPDVLRRHFYHDATDDDFVWAAARVRQQAIAPFAARVQLSAAQFGAVPRAYIHCRHDRAIGLALQRQMALAAGCSPMLYLKSGHSPFVTQPAALCAMLVELAEDHAI